jgi:hypothetical protein
MQLPVEGPLEKLPVPPLPAAYLFDYPTCSERCRQEALFTL